MKKTGLVLALAAVAGLSGCSKVVPKLRGYFADGQKELQAALQAKAAAKSFHMTTKIAAHDDNVMETHFAVSCPDREQINLKIGNINRQMIRIAQRFYLNEDGTWYYKDVDVKNWSPCGQNAGLPSPWALLTEGRDMIAVFASAGDKFKVDAADPVDYKGTTYAAWNVSMSHGGGPFKYTVLLDKQHRPAAVMLGQSSITEYSDWDKPVAIEAPANALPFPESPEQAAPASPAAAHGKGM